MFSLELDLKYEFLLFVSHVPSLWKMIPNLKLVSKSTHPSYESHYDQSFSPTMFNFSLVLIITCNVKAERTSEEERPHKTLCPHDEWSLWCHPVDILSLVGGHVWCVITVLWPGTEEELPVCATMDQCATMQTSSRAVHRYILVAWSHTGLRQESFTCVLPAIHQHRIERK